MNNVSVRVYPINNGGSIKANISLNIDDIVVINDFRLIEGKNGLFISAPQRSYEADGKTVYRDIAYFLDKETREDFEDAVLSEYEKATSTNKKKSRR